MPGLAAKAEEVVERGAPEAGRQTTRKEILQQRRLRGVKKAGQPALGHRAHLPPVAQHAGPATKRTWLRGRARREEEEQDGGEEGRDTAPPPPAPATMRRGNRACHHSRTQPCALFFVCFECTG